MASSSTSTSDFYDDITLVSDSPAVYNNKTLLGGAGTYSIRFNEPTGMPHRSSFETYCSVGRETEDYVKVVVDTSMQPLGSVYTGSLTFTTRIPTSYIIDEHEGTSVLIVSIVGQVVSWTFTAPVGYEVGSFHIYSSNIYSSSSSELLTSSSSSSSSSSTSTSSSSISSSSSTSSSQSQWYERIENYISLDIDQNLGTPLLVGRGTESHIAIFTINRFNDQVDGYKLLQKTVTSGDIIVNQQDYTLIPFSLTSVSDQQLQSELPMSFGAISTEKPNFNYDAFEKSPINILYSNAKTQNVILPPNKSNIENDEAIVKTEIWVNDFSGTKEIKIGTIKDLPKEKFISPGTNTFYAPFFSWSSNPILTQQRFMISKTDGTLILMKFDNLNYLFEETNFLYKDNNPLDANSINSLVTLGNGYGFIGSENGIAKINLNDFVITNAIFTLKNAVVHCTGLNRNIYVTSNDSLIKIDSNLVQTPIKNTMAIDKAIWSTYHTYLFILGKYTVAYMQNDTTITIIDESNTYTFKDIATYKNGIVAILSTNNSNYIIKFLNEDLSLKYNISTSIPLNQILFSKNGYLWAISENNHQYILFIVDSNSGQYYQSKTLGLDSSLASFVYNEELSSFFIFTQNGRCIEIKDTGNYDNIIFKEIAELQLSKNVTIAGVFNSSPMVFYTKDSKHYYDKVGQKKVRVFVGSKSLQSDRWDSGEIETNKTCILYGGGNNLKPGYKYFVNIMVYYDNVGWTNIQTKEFIAPR